MKLDKKTAAGFLITAACLWWAFRGEDLGEIAHVVAGADWLLLGLAALVATLGIPIRAMRWRVLLRPFAPDVPFPPRHAATAIGFAANNVLPARVGEFARAFALSRLARIPMPAVLGSMVIERVFDGLVIVSLLFVAMAAPSFPDIAVGGADPRIYARITAGIAGTLGLVLLALAIAPKRSVALVDRVAGAVLPESFRRPLVDSLHAFVGGLAVLRSPGLIALSALWAVGQWLFTGVSYLLALRAFGIDGVSYMGALFVQSVVSIAVAVPAAPGFFGVSEAASKLALAPWGLDATQVISYAIGYHIAGWIPVTALGFFLMWHSKLSWSEMRNSEETVEEAVEADPALGAPPPEEPAGRA